jgi:uncharacterized membrane protein
MNSSAPKLRAVHIAMLGLILCVGTFLRYYKIGSLSLSTDELLSLEVSSGHGYEHLDLSKQVILNSPNELIDLNHAGSWSQIYFSLGRSNHPPLYFYLLRIWRLMLHSDTDAALRSLSMVFSLFAVLLAFDAVRWSSGIGTALWAAALLAVASPQIEFAQEARGYSMLVAFMMGCCAALSRIEYLGFNRRRIAALFFCAFCMLMTHYLAFSVLAALIIYVAICFSREIRRPALLALAAATILFVIIWTPILWAQQHTFMPNLAWMKEPIEGHIPRLLNRLALLPLRFFSSSKINPGYAAYLSVLLFILPIPLLRKHPELLMWCLIIWIVVATVATGDLLRVTGSLMFRRYTVAAAAAANILIAIILANSDRWLRHSALAVILLSSAMTLPLSYGRNKPDWRPMASYIDKNAKSDSVAVYFPDYQSFAYAGLMKIALSHYSRNMPEQVVMLDHPADASLLQQLRSHGVIDVISGGAEPDEILSNCKLIGQSSFPGVGSFSRVELPPSVADNSDH